jgi:hypothetical protein
MLQISDRKQERIVENRTCKVERYAVLAFVCSSLDFIPLELKLAAMQTILSRTEALRAPKLMNSPFPLPWAMVGNAQRERWHLWQSRQLGIYNLQNPLGPQGFESHSLRHTKVGLRANHNKTKIKLMFARL